MQFGNFGSILRKDKDEIHWVGAGYGESLDLLNRAWLVGVLRGAFEDRFQPWCILKLFISIGILLNLKGWNRMVGSELGPHLGKNWKLLSAPLLPFAIDSSQFKVVFILPTLTNKQTIAIFSAAPRSERSLSFNILLVLLLLAIASI